jgi:D-alanyl-D-alanine carboxypeptidase
LIIETITGQPYAVAVRQRIRTPASLSNTFTELHDSIAGGFVQGYQDWNGDGTPENVTQPLINDGLGLADKGIISNAPDLVRFFQVLFLGDKLLYSASLDQMLETTPMGMGDAYGLGMTHMETRWGEAWGHQGKALGFQSVFLYLPVHDLMLVVWANDGDKQQDGVMSIAQDVLSTILGEPDFRW